MAIRKSKLQRAIETHLGYGPDFGSILPNVRLRKPGR